MSVQGANAAVRSHSKAAPACQTSVPPVVSLINVTMSATLKSREA